MLSGIGRRPRATGVALTAFLATALTTGLAGCGNVGGEPSSLDDIPPGNQRSDSDGTPDQGDRGRGQAPDATDPPTGTPPGTRQIVVDCARVRLDLPPTWGTVDQDGLWTFTPPGDGRGRLMVRGEPGRTDEPVNRQRLERLAGDGGAATIRSDGSMFGLGKTKAGDPTWRIAVGAEDRTQVVILTYAATTATPDREAASFRADIDQLHQTVATLQLGQPGDCPE